MSGAVGSMPSLTRSGRGRSGSLCRAARIFASSAPSGRESTAFRASHAACRAGSGVADAIGPNASFWGRRPTASPSLMTDDRGSLHPATRVDPPGVIPFPREGAPPPPPPDQWLDDDHWDEDGGEPPRPPKPKLKKLRLFLILCGLGLLGAISFIFGMFMAVSADLPQLETRTEFQHAKNSVILDAAGKPLGVLSKQNRILVK